MDEVLAHPGDEEDLVVHRESEQDTHEDDRHEADHRTGPRDVEGLGEHAVLEALITRPGRAVPKEKLFDEVFALSDDANVDAIELYIHRVRKKLDKVAANGAAITTLRGIGYMLQPREATDGAK